jgi:hypothetical protein
VGVLRQDIDMLEEILLHEIVVASDIVRSYAAIFIEVE